MSLETLVIPEKLFVGFQERSDTYSGKLAYVIYKDHKGVLRKQASWERWCSKDIEKLELDNVPMSGFVLNRDVGGVRRSWSSWNPRMEKVRVYDPRGFEIEITIPNMLFIFQECSSIKGKGIEGELVYSWDGTGLVLLPVTCEEYKKSASYSQKIKTKFDVKSLKPGFSYLSKDGRHTHIYMGRHVCWQRGGILGKLAHVFSVNGSFSTVSSPDYDCQAGDEPSPDFPELYQKFVSNNTRYAWELKTGKALSLSLGKFDIIKPGLDRNTSSLISTSLCSERPASYYGYAQKDEGSPFTFGVSYNGGLYTCRITHGTKGYDYKTNAYVQVPPKIAIIKKFTIKNGMLEGTVLKTPIDLSIEDFKNIEIGNIVVRTDFNVSYGIESKRIMG